MNNINSLQSDKIKDLSKFKAFAGNKKDVTTKQIFFFLG